MYTLDIEDLASLKTLIGFCYTGRMVLTMHNVLPIAKAAASLLIQNAMSLCFKYITTQLNAANCIHYFIGARDIFPVFQNYLKSYAVEHFGEIVDNESMVLLSADELSAFLRRDNLPIDSQETLFNALMKWYRHDVNNRQDAMKDMLPLIRYGDLTSKVCV